MSRKKILVGIFAFVLLSSVLCFTLAAADSPDLNTLTSGVSDFFKPMLEKLFGQTSNIFELLLFTLIIIAAVFMALENVPVIKENPFALWTLTLASAVLATRYIGTMDIVQTLLFPQGVFGIALITLLPFVVFFWFVEFGLAGAKARILRRICWLIFAGIYFFMWYQKFYSVGGGISSWGYLYLIAGLLAILVAVIDKFIQKNIKNMDFESAKERAKSIKLAELMQEHKRLTGLLGTTTAGTPTHRDLMEQIREIDKQMKEVNKIGS